MQYINNITKGILFIMIVISSICLYNINQPDKNGFSITAGINNHYKILSIKNSDSRSGKTIDLHLSSHKSVQDYLMYNSKDNLSSNLVKAIGSNLASYKDYESFATSKYIVNEMSASDNPHEYIESSFIIYISEYDNNDVIACNIKSNVFTRCHAVVTDLNGPENILVYNNKLYILDFNVPAITFCDLNHFGEASNCHKEAIPLEYPVYILANNRQLYVSDMGEHNVIGCNLNYNGDLLSCYNKANVSKDQFEMVYFKNYSYRVNNLANLIDRCATNKAECSVIKDSVINGPLTLSIANGYAFISNYNTNSVSMCNIEQDGSFTSCRVGVSGLNFPIGIAVNIINLEFDAI